MKTRISPAAALLAACLVLGAGEAARGQVLLKSISHVKGQEENTLNGLGLVVGLKGTGDGGGMLPAMRSLAAVIESMGAPLGNGGLYELKDAKNVALVMVTAVIPAEGLRQGSNIDCTVSSIGSAKSLAGGVLFSTPLLGPDKESQEIYAVSEGRLSLDDAQTLTTARIHNGCRMEQDVRHGFLDGGEFTIVLDRFHADFQLASEIANAINSERKIETEGLAIARAIDQANIVVTIPESEVGYETEFIGQVLEIPAPIVARTPKVVINRRSGAIAISGDVEIGPVVVSHKGVQIDASDSLAPDRFVPVDTRNETGLAGSDRMKEFSAALKSLEEGDPNANQGAKMQDLAKKLKALDANDPGNQRGAKLKDLVDALQAIKVPTEDLISIIEGIDKNGKLYADLIIE